MKELILTLIYHPILFISITWMFAIIGTVLFFVCLVYHLNKVDDVPHLSDEQLEQTLRQYCGCRTCMEAHKPPR